MNEFKPRLIQTSKRENIKWSQIEERLFSIFGINCTCPTLVSVYHFQLCQDSENVAPIDRMMAHFSQMRGEELRARMSTICVFRCRTEGSASLPSLLVFSGQPDISTHLLYTQIGVKALCELIVAALTVLSCFKKPLSCFWRLEGGGLARALGLLQLRHRNSHTAFHFHFPGTAESWAAFIQWRVLPPWKVLSVLHTTDLPGGDQTFYGGIATTQERYGGNSEFRGASLTRFLLNT